MPKKITPPGVTKTSKKDDMKETAQAPVNVPERKAEEAPVYTPRVSVSPRGKIGQTLEAVADEFRSRHPDQEVRWVFHSARKPELSNVMSRLAEGYTMVEPSDLEGYPIDSFVDERSHLRVADVVLMKIPSGQRKVNLEARQRLADAQVDIVKEGFQVAMESAQAGQHSAAARGSLKVESRDHNLDYTQPSKE